MKFINIIFTLFISAAILAGCEKTMNEDVSFPGTAPQAAAVSAFFDITQDNTGLVTITPNGEGVSYYELYFGDATTTAMKVYPGKNVQHKYAEGNYSVKVVAYNVAGEKTEATKPLTVSYRQPENMEVTAAVDGANNMQVNVTAKATYETYFKVFFGDVANEVPKSFSEGETVNHIYAAPGTYTIIVVALSGGAATTTIKKTITIVNPLLLPITFESSTLDYTFTNFDGGVVTTVNNPYSTGINTSSKVGKMVKYPGQTWGGSWIGLGAPIDFSAGKIFRMKVYSPRVGAKVLLKVENASNSSISFEKEATTTVANAWEDLVFDYSAINTSNQYNHIVLIFDNGTMGDGSANFTFYFDDIRLTNTLPSMAIDLPLNFENTSLNYVFTGFDGGNVIVINNPNITGINTSSRVGKMIKSAGQTWGGSFITLTNPIDFSTKKIFKMKVFSPRVGAKVLLKVENATNGAVSFEKEVATTVANAWEELTFDYSAIDATKSYQKVVLIFDNGTMGDGSANFTFLFDDITLN